MLDGFQSGESHGPLRPVGTGVRRYDVRGVRCLNKMSPGESLAKAGAHCGEWVPAFAGMT